MAVIEMCVDCIDTFGDVEDIAHFITLVSSQIRRTKCLSDYMSSHYYFGLTFLTSSSLFDLNFFLFESGRVEICVDCIDIFGDVEDAAARVRRQLRPARVEHPA